MECALHEHVGNNFFETFDGSPGPTSAAWPARFIIPSAKIHMTTQGAEAERNAAITPPTEQNKLVFWFESLNRMCPFVLQKLDFPESPKSSKRGELT